jgi:glycerol kinase
MLSDFGDGKEVVLRVDGGMTASDWTMQFLADMLAAPVDRPACLETTSVGAAYLAGLQAGLYPDPNGFAARWQAERRFEPSMPEPVRAAKYRGWCDALARALLRP